jgi:DinB superfamily
MHPATLQALAAFPDQLTAHYHAFPAGYENWAPPAWDGIPSEQLTALEQICHVRDIEIDGYHLRLHRTLDETNPTLISIDTDALATERAYARADASAALSSFRAARALTVSLVAALRPEQLQRPAVFEGYGPVTLRSLVHYLCSHDQQHLAGLQWLLGKLDAARAAGRA